jgi:type IV pilus assembly protein PilC
MTLASGMDMDSVMRYAVSLVEDEAYKAKFQSCLQVIEGGGKLSDAITKTETFSQMHIKLIELAHKTGDIDSVMKRVSELCGDEAEIALNNATSVIEPLLVGILAVVIGTVLISVMFPLVQVMSNIA